MENNIESLIDTYLSNQGEDFNRRHSQTLNSDFYPAQSYKPERIAQIRELDLGDNVKTAGRVISKRDMGKTIFLTIQEGGNRIQIYANKKTLDDYDFIKKELDIGDIVGFEGDLFRTKTDELTVKAIGYKVLGKSLRPLPDKHAGLKDEHLRIKRRHLDLIVNEESRNALHVRNIANQAIRNYLIDNNFIEVETPILQPIYGGANARPFITNLNAEGRVPAYLRISNELYLKRLIMGGLERVFEFAKDFRNEGIDKTHNPEFTQLELYQAYADYFDMMDRAEAIFSNVAKKLGRSQYNFMGNNIDLDKKWKRISMEDSIIEIGELNLDLNDREKVISFARENNIGLDKESNYGNALLGIFEEYVESKLIQPIIIYDYPIEVSPLAKNHRFKPGMVERFEFFIGGKEFGNAYSELNDPIEQRRRLLHQQSMKDSDDEVHPIDEDFLEAMEYGMPQTGGLGIGMDRLAMLFAQRNTIRDVLYFPFKKPSGN
ncbi:MAG: lysine--tRNA ligase [Nanoarchaeota archaeon]|nr:lysine--tRNA ligase [Nanoarchaeota archaeon]